MTKKKILWIALGVLLALLLILGSVIIKNTQEDPDPPVILPTEFTDQEVQDPSESNSSIPQETSEFSEESSESTEVSESTELSESTEPSRETERDPVPSQPLTPPTAPPTTPPTSSNEDEELQAQIDALIAEIYALRDYYIAQLAYLEDYARTTYNALPPAEKTPERKQQIAMECIDNAYALESECDSRMDAICGELGYLLLQTNGNLSLVNEVRYAYASEKEQAKSAFMEKYADYFG